MNKAKYVDIHVVQTVPPSCVNRDDMGSPKTALFGGVRRSRVSSQSWKHAMRKMFPEIYGEEFTGKRTVMVHKLVVDAILKEEPSLSVEKAEKMAASALTDAGIKLSADNIAAAMFFMSLAQADALAKLAIAGETDKKKYQKALSENPSIDMALFGRMVASDTSLNIDASVQVAHAISTHAVQTEFDYFTAVDDILSSEEGATATRHLGTVEYNSSTLYRFATVSLNDLAATLGEDEVVKALCGFVKAMIVSMPTGHQNSFANRTVPDAVYITVRHDQPVNLAGAFEKPISASNGGFAEPSVKKLGEYAQELYKTFAPAPDQAFVIGEGLSDMGEKGSLQDMLTWLEKVVAEDNV